MYEFLTRWGSIDEKLTLYGTDNAVKTAFASGCACTRGKKTLGHNFFSGNRTLPIVSIVFSSTCSAFSVIGIFSSMLTSG